MTILSDLHHSQILKTNQCTSILVQNVNAPLELVWSFLRRFDRPEAFKKFVRKCTMVAGSGGSVGSIREVRLISGMPGSVCWERLDRLDDDRHVLIYTMIDGDQRLENYRSTITVHKEGGRTVVVQSYVVDVPEGNNEEETRIFVDTVLGCDLRSLANVTERLASNCKKLNY